MVIVPYYPIRDEIMKKIIVLKLRKVQMRLAENHRIELSWNDALVDEVDFLTVIGECGLEAELDPCDTGSRACLEGAFSDDGYVDTLDIVSWDWAMDDTSRLGSYCGVSLAPGEAYPAPPAANLSLAPQVTVANLAGNLDDVRHLVAILGELDVDAA